MLKGNSRFERIWSGLGLGIFFILLGSLIFAGNKGWLSGGEGWLYFAIGLGGIFIVGFLARFVINPSNRWSDLGGLVLGVCLVYIGIAFLYGFGDWWPMVFIPVGIVYIAKGIWQSQNHTFAP
jgi:hypothetical protein